MVDFAVLTRKLKEWKLIKIKHGCSCNFRSAEMCAMDSDKKYDCRCPCHKEALEIKV